MRVSKLFALALAALVLLPATAARAPVSPSGSFGIVAGTGPYFSGSRIPLQVTGAPGRASFTAISGGTIDGNVFEAPYVDAKSPGGVIGAAQGAIAYSTIDVLPAPPKSRALIAVASYDDGVALHDAGTFALLGFVGIGGPPGDVAFTSDGDLLAPNTDGTTMLWASRSPWRARFIDGVALGNEVAWDARSGSAFVTNRDVNGMGAVTRVAPDGTTSRTVTGMTAEGIAIDANSSNVYVANVNDSTVAQVDAETLALVRHLRAPQRAFGLALDARRRRLFVVANISPDMRSGSGYVQSYSLDGRPIARSSGMTFPLGIALDKSGRRAFVTDEASNAVYVLDASTLKAAHAPLQTCGTPWRPRIFHDRLYVPCTHDDEIDVIDTRTLRRVHGAPFHTGGFPLSVAVWP